MKEQNAESKLEQAAEAYAHEEFGNYLTTSLENRVKISTSKRAFIAGAKSEAAKEYWQSLTTPASNEVEAVLKKYKTFVSNIEWHIKTNEPKGDDLKQCELKLDCYSEIVTDLERIPSKPRTVEETE